MKLVSRAHCGLRPPKSVSSLPIERAVGIAVHYSGTLAERDLDGCRVMRIHQDFHMRPGGLGVPNGGSDIAYNWEGDHRGNLFEGRGWGVRSGANGTNDANSKFYAYCFQGADRENFRDFTVQAANAFTDLCIEFKRRKGVWPIVKGHREFKNTACPGNEIMSYIALEPWKVEFKPWPVPLPAWWWAWNAWRLGEGMFKEHGPRNMGVRHLTGAPRLIPPWAWSRAVTFDRARKGA